MVLTLVQVARATDYGHQKPAHVAWIARRLCFCRVTIRDLQRVRYTHTTRGRQIALMTAIAESVLQAKLSDLQAHARKTWSGRERESVIKIVRFADYAAYIIHCSSEEGSLDNAALNELRLILSSVAPALAIFLPLMKGGRAAAFQPVDASSRPLERPKLVHK